MQVIQSKCFILNGDEFESMCLQANGMYGEISGYHFSRSLDVIYSCLAKYSRVCAMRVDLRFAQDSWNDDPDLPTCFQRTDSKVITRFFESLKSQLKEEHRSGNHTERALAQLKATVQHTVDAAQQI